MLSGDHQVDVDTFTDANGAFGGASTSLMGIMDIFGVLGTDRGMILSRLN